MFQRAGLLAVLAASVFATSAVAQDAALPGCELHLWPSGKLNSVYYGWFHGGIVNGAVTGRDGYPEVPPDPLGAAPQAALLGEVDTQKVTGRADYTLVVHPEPLTSRAIRTTPGRLSDAAAACYAELIVDDIFLQQDVFHGSFLKSSLRFRDFGNDGAAVPVRVFGSWVQTQLLRFPPKKPADLDPASAELKAAYRQNLSLFTAALHKPAKAKRKG